ncbi:MAG: hypothetical protein A2Y91_01765 [Chloroflexi bacterium RBG_13_54_8]|nr:MAG: hypothetical protein A2Y91_01765 [Chloroflexi bacterium RBG_13_54_8]
MPCGISSEFLYERLKAAEAEGSEIARQLIDEFVFHQESGPTETGSGEEPEGNIENPGMGKKHCQRR